MLRKIVFLMVFLVGTVSVVSGQTSTKMDARAVLTDLGRMLTEIPESTKDCQALLKKVKAWQVEQVEKLKELEKPKFTISITEPKDEAFVPERPSVKGTISDSSAKVWVIVHPMRESKYWVQPSITVQDSAWEVVAYIGKGETGVGERFEIMAVVNPKKELKAGDILPGWPEAQSKSQVIQVTRK
jgi:hypothetical protein